MIDYNDYVGIPWVCGQATLDGADCWGIVTMILAEALGVSIAHYPIDSINSEEKKLATLQKEVNSELSKGTWKKVPTPSEFDVVMMLNRKSCKPEHVGIYIGNGLILHSMTCENGISEIHQTKLISRFFKRLEYYRYVG